MHVDNKAHRLLCPAVISGVKFFNVERHYKIYLAKYECYKGESRKSELESLKSARKQQTSMFKCNESEEITKISHKVNHLLAFSIKPYLDGEIMKQTIVIFAEELFCKYST